MRGERKRVTSVLCVLLLTGGLAYAGPDIVLDNGLEVWLMGSGPTAPAAVDEHIVSGSQIPSTAVRLTQVPTSSWTYGCSATAAGMMFGYYDRTGFSNMYTGPFNGGVAPLTNLGGTTSLIATARGLDGRVTYGHVDNYWKSLNATGPDPWEGVRAEHQWECVADFMGTNQWKWDYYSEGKKNFNRDGTTALFSYSGPQRLYNYFPPASSGLPRTELCSGMGLFVESRGYEVVTNYTQKIHERYAGGFTFGDYMAEIDAGRPVMIQVVGHSMVGVGYDEATRTVYLHDTWGDYLASMTWGGSYSGMLHEAVTVMHIVPEPASVSVLALMVLVLRRRRRKM